MKWLSKSLVVLAIVIIAASIYYGSREIVTLAFIIPANLLVLYFLLKRKINIESKSSLSRNDVKERLLGNAIIYLVLTVIVCGGLLFYINLKTPIFGEAYATRAYGKELRQAERNEKLGISNDIFDAEETVRRTMKDPSSAQFKGSRKGKNNTICGQVNGKNSFGAYSGFERFIVSSNTPFIDDGSVMFSDNWNDNCN